MTDLSGMLRSGRSSLMLDAAELAADEIERLRTALTGIASCSTCEACRGAATLALGDTETPAECSHAPGQFVYCPKCDGTTETTGDGAK